MYACTQYPVQTDPKLESHLPSIYVCHVCVCVFVCMYVCMHSILCREIQNLRFICHPYTPVICVYIFMCMNVCMDVCMHSIPCAERSRTWESFAIHIRQRYLHVCMYAFMYVLYVCVCVYIYIYIHTYTFLYAQTHTHARNHSLKTSI